MARIRSIKPDFFKDEDLAEHEPLTRLLFAGLWTTSDREGRQEDRPKLIKAEILPYDDCDIEAMLNALARPKPEPRESFIIRYAVDGRRFICIPGFTKHQRISGKEAETPSNIPPPPGREATEKHSGSTGDQLESQEGKGKEGKEEMEGKGTDVGAKHPRPSLLFDIWNLKAKGSGMPPALKLSEARLVKCRARLRECPLEQWGEIFSRMAKIPFLNGDNPRGWHASFDWIIANSDNAIKVMEGKYDSVQGVERKAGYASPGGTRERVIDN